MNDREYYFEKSSEPSEELQQIFEKFSPYVSCELVERGKPAVAIVKVTPKYNGRSRLITGSDPEGVRQVLKMCITSDCSSNENILEKVSRL